MSDLGRQKSGHRRVIEARQVNWAASGLSRHDYACRVALHRRVGARWLCIARYDSLAQAIKESRPGDVVWWHHRGREWVPFVRCI